GGIVLSVAALASDNLVSLVCVWLRRARARRVETCRAPRADTFCYEKVGQICNLTSRCYFSYSQVTNYCDAVHRLCRTRIFAFHRNPEFHHQNIQSGSEPTKCCAVRRFCRCKGMSASHGIAQASFLSVHIKFLVRNHWSCL